MTLGLFTTTTFISKTSIIYSWQKPFIYYAKLVFWVHNFDIIIKSLPLVKLIVAFSPNISFEIPSGKVFRIFVLVSYFVPLTK